MIVPPAIKKGVSHFPPIRSTVSLAIRMPSHVGHTKIPGSATFPNGLPEALGASVALQTSPEPVSSDSDNGGMQLLLGDLFFSLAMLIKPQDVSAKREREPAIAARRGRAPPELGLGALAPRACARPQLMHQLMSLPTLPHTLLEHLRTS